MYYYCQKHISLPELEKWYYGSRVWVENVSDPENSFHAIVISEFEINDGVPPANRIILNGGNFRIALTKSNYGPKHEYVCYPFRPAGGIRK